MELNKTKNLAVITARGGSKRIPGKNRKEFYGKPILSYSIEAALESGIFDEVMVSTEDEEIAAIARKYGANVPFYRSEKNSSDYATTVDVLLEVITAYEKVGKRYETTCCIYPTAPFITKEKLRWCYEKLLESEVEAVIPVVRFSYPPQRCFVIRDGKLFYKWPQNICKRSQDLETFYHDAGQFYFMKTDILRKTKTLVPPKTVPYLIDEMEVQDIDKIQDWEIAEFKYQYLNRRRGK